MGPQNTQQGEVVIQSSASEQEVIVENISEPQPELMEQLPESNNILIRFFDKHPRWATSFFFFLSFDDRRALTPLK